MFGTDAGEDRRVDDPGAKRIVVKCGDVGAGHRGADVKAEVATDFLGDDGVVAGDDLDGDAERREAFEGCGGVKFGLVQEHEVAGQGEVVFVGSGRGVGSGGGTGGDRNDTPPGGELGIEGVTSRFGHVATGGEDGFGCAFGDEEPTPAGIVDQHARHPPVVVERDSREPRTPLRDDAVAVSGASQRDVEGVATHGSAVFNRGFVADQAEPEHLGIGASGQVHGAHEADATFGERAGLVREQDLDVTEILDAHETLDEHTLAGKTTQPVARLVVTTAGSNWGVMPTAIASEKSSDSSSGHPKIMLITKIDVVRTPATSTSSTEKWRSPAWNSVTSWRSPKPAAILPNSVRRPVLTTTPSPSPLLTTVPMKAHDERSPSAESPRPVRPPCRRAATRP